MLRSPSALEGSYNIVVMHVFANSPRQAPILLRCRRRRHVQPVSWRVLSSAERRSLAFQTVLTPRRPSGICVLPWQHALQVQWEHADA